jgi:hypothetical protein
VLRRIFGPKRDEVTGEWRRLHNEHLYALYSLPHNFNQKASLAGNVARMGEERAWRVLVKIPEG